MHLNNINEYCTYLVIAGDNVLHRYKVKGDKLRELFIKHKRVVYIGLVQGFECYVKNPETGQCGWDIVWIEGVKEAIQRHYPHFDSFITQDYPRSGQELIKFNKLERDDYKMKAFTTDGEDKMDDQRIEDLFDTLIDDDVHTTIDYIIAKGSSLTPAELLEIYDNRA